MGMDGDGPRSAPSDSLVFRGEDGLPSIPPMSLFHHVSEAEKQSAETRRAILVARYLHPPLRTSYSPLMRVFYVR